MPPLKIERGNRMEALKDHKLSNAREVRPTNAVIYALGMFGITIPGQMYSTYATFFYNDKLHLPLYMISVGMIFFTIWDAFNDPLMGYLSDRTRTRIGRRRPWLLAAAPLFCLFYILFFAPPGGLEAGIPLAIYFTVFLMLLETMGTVTGTNYHSLFPELFKTGKSRTFANSLRQALQLVGMIIGVSLTPMLAEKFGYTATAAFLSILGMSLLVVSTFGSHEDPNYRATETPGLRESMKAVIGNRNFWTVSFANFFYQATAGLLLAAIPYYVKYALGLKDSSATFLTAAVFVTAIPAMILWAKLINKSGALKMWRIALAFLGLSVVPMFFAASLTSAMIFGAFVGIGVAGVTANIDLINAKIIDEDAAASGLRREGIYTSAISFVIRFSGFARSLIFLLITLIFGFVDSTNTGSNPGMAARFMFSVFPILLMAISYSISRFVKFHSDGSGKEPTGGLADSRQ